MNFLQLIASGASFLNFNFQSKSSQSVQSIPKSIEKQQGFKKVDHSNAQMNNLNHLHQQIPNEQASILNHLLYNERQELINRYLQLNLHLLEDKISKPQQQQNQISNQVLNEQIQERESNQGLQKNNSSKKKIKKQVKCGHDDKAHYAKGLCNNCYHKYGRTKKPWNCHHEKLYAGGMCQNCYINMYNKKKREQNLIQDEKIDSIEDARESHVVLSNEKPEQRKETEVEQSQKLEQQ